MDASAGHTGQALGTIPMQLRGRKTRAGQALTKRIGQNPDASK